MENYMHGQDYFSYERNEISSLIPTCVERVLEIGCGAGKTLAWIKSEHKSLWIGGAEFSHDAAQQASKVLDAVFEGDIETMVLPIPESSIDLILCLDVLEHLKNPWHVIERLHHLLKPSGCIIASIPNIRYFKVSLPLVFRGWWEYEDAGILDRSHLRFFTRRTAVKLIESSGLKIDRIESTGLSGASASRLINMLTFSMIQPFFEYQYLIRAVRVN